MRLRLICIGKTKESFVRSGQEFYAQKLKRFGSLEIICLPEEGYLRLTEEEKKRKEAVHFEKYFSRDTYSIAWDREGASLSSQSWAGMIGKCLDQSRSKIDLLVGGSVGLAQSVLDQADRVVSLSAMTFPHELVRLIILEQTYCALTILRNEAYHK